MTNSFFDRFKEPVFTEFKIEGLEDVKIKHLTESEKAEHWQQWFKKPNGDPDPKRAPKLLARLIQLCVYSGDSPAFDESDIDRLMDIPADEFERISEHCLSCISYDSEADGKK